MLRIPIGSSPPPGESVIGGGFLYKLGTPHEALDGLSFDADQGFTFKPGELREMHSMLRRPSNWAILRADSSDPWTLVCLDDPEHVLIRSLPLRANEELQLSTSAAVHLKILAGRGELMSADDLLTRYGPRPSPSLKVGSEPKATSTRDVGGRGSLPELSAEEIDLLFSDLPGPIEPRPAASGPDVPVSVDPSGPPSFEWGADVDVDSFEIPETEEPLRHPGTTRDPHSVGDEASAPRTLTRKERQMRLLDTETAGRRPDSRSTGTDGRTKRMGKGAAKSDPPRPSSAAASGVTLRRLRVFPEGVVVGGVDLNQYERELVVAGALLLAERELSGVDPNLGLHLAGLRSGIATGSGSDRAVRDGLLTAKSFIESEILFVQPASGRPLLTRLDDEGKVREMITLSGVRVSDVGIWDHVSASIMPGIIENLRSEADPDEMRPLLVRLARSISASTRAPGEDAVRSATEMLLTIRPEGLQTEMLRLGCALIAVCELPDVATVRARLQAAAAPGTEVQVETATRFAFAERLRREGLDLESLGVELDRSAVSAPDHSGLRAAFGFPVADSRLPDFPGLESLAFGGTGITGSDLSSAYGQALSDGSAPTFLAALSASPSLVRHPEVLRALRPLADAGDALLHDVFQGILLASEGVIPAEPSHEVAHTWSVRSPTRP